MVDAAGIHFRPYTFLCYIRFFVYFRKVKSKILELMPDCPERLLPKIANTVTFERMKNDNGQAQQFSHKQYNL